MLKAVVTRFGLASLAVVMLMVGFLTFTASASADDGHAGQVMTESNAAGGNAVLMYQRAADGTLTAAGSFATGGLGTGAGLGSQDALTLSDEGRWLIAVNAGSNDISVLSMKDGSVAARTGSGGATPISVTAHDRLVYVVNAGSANISGFWLGHNGTLTPIAGSQRSLTGTGPAQIQFSPDGNVLVVTEKATSTIDTFTVNDDGTAGNAVSHPSSGSTPFGFDFARRTTLVVSEAATSAASSYRVSRNGNVNLVSGSVVNGQQAACWLAVTNNGRYAYTADAHNGMISSYAVGNDGSLSLLNGTAGTPGGAPLDEAVSRNDKFLYVLNPSMGAMNAFAIHGDGSLDALANTSGIPSSAAGLIAQ